MKITIITVCFNAANGLIETAESILNQQYNDIEWIVVDGKSTDNTEEIIKLYRDKLIKRGIEVNFRSEKDYGIYDAMNKGIDRASGEWCIFMNAGDSFYSDGSLENLVINDIDKFDIIYGDANHVYNNKFKFYPAKNEKDLSFINGMEFCHQSAIIRKEILKKLRYSTNYKIAGDFDFFVRAFKVPCRFKHVEKIISEFQMDGISSTNGAKGILENNEIKLNHNLIEANEYQKIKKRYTLYLNLRNMLPRRIVKMRHEYIMKKDTQEWKTK